ncbi:UNVERIFIED_CONTAM: hypothetical protein GTU68_056858 [Idotea baltica]|nr:hypothetical protein [Idotea baltica]
MAIELLAERFDERLVSAPADALVATARVDGQRVALCVPQTYMNESGRSVAPLMKRCGIADDPERLVVIHDELDLEPGRVKLKRGGGLAGHNGLRSIAAHCHTQEFLRVRIGVGKPPGGASKGANHVLARPPGAVRDEFHQSIVTAADSIEAILSAGMDAAMGDFNRS